MKRNIIKCDIIIIIVNIKLFFKIKMYLGPNRDIPGSIWALGSGYTHNCDYG